MEPSASRVGFTLIELSIALVILGLVIGGATLGASLIRSSELKAVAVQRNQIATAVRGFREKYNGLPGDIKDATQYWGAAAAPASCATTVGTGTQTCDGDGNGKIDYSNTGGTSQENFRFWQQLANAGFMEGSYSGYGATATATPANSPRGKISNTLWAVGYLGAVPTGNGQFFTGEYGNVLYFGGAQ